MRDLSQRSVLLGTGVLTFFTTGLIASSESGTQTLLLIGAALMTAGFLWSVRNDHATGQQEHNRRLSLIVFRTWEAQYSQNVPELVVVVQVDMLLPDVEALATDITASINEVPVFLTERLPRFRRGRNEFFVGRIT